MTVTKYKALLPNRELLNKCPYPTNYIIADNGDLVRYLKKVMDSLDKCNIDKKYLRRWYNSVKDINMR